MKYAKMRILFLILIYALSVFRSLLHRGKKQDTEIHRLGVNLRTEIKEKKRGVICEGKHEFHLTKF